MKAIAPESGITVEITSATPPLGPEVEGAAEALSRRLTGDNGSHVVAYGTEGGLFQGEGWSTVVCGPGDIAQAHQPDEFITVAQLDAGTLSCAASSPSCRAETSRHGDCIGDEGWRPRRSENSSIWNEKAAVALDAAVEASLICVFSFDRAPTHVRGVRKPLPGGVGSSTALGATEPCRSRPHCLAAVAALALMCGSVQAQTLRYANQGELKSLDPYTVNETTTNAHLGHPYEGLIRARPGPQDRAGLAEKWEISPDGLTWRLLPAQERQVP
jgi:hypothetical protein